MYFDQRGPLIFSASLHFALIVVFIIKSMVQPEKEPEELIFELYSPPASAGAIESKPVEYVPEDLDLPTPDEIPDPEPRELPPEPVAIPEEVIPAEPEPPKVINFDDFRSTNPIRKQRVPTKKPPPKRNNQLDKVVENLVSGLKDIDVVLPESAIGSLTASDQSQLESYFGQLIQAISGSVEIHPLAGSPLKTKVQFDLAPTGRISGARVVASSGDAVFDQKVIDGFKRLARFKAPPGFTSTETLALTIKQSDL